MEIPRQLNTLAAAMILAPASITVATESPAPTPTPRPGSLAAMAGSATLSRPAGGDAAEPIFITDANLDELSGGAVVTVLTSTAAEFTEITIDDGVDPKTRQRWRSKVLSQSKAIARLEARRESIETEIDRLGRGKLDSRTLDRISKAEEKLRVVDREIKIEKASLSRIIREARKEGAQPGWFR